MTEEYILSEGKARIAISMDGYKVFYNPLAKPTRTLGVAFVYGEGLFRNNELVIADVLAATGVRGIRYVLESGYVSKAFFNDKSKLAYRVIAKNIENNGINILSQLTRMDANRFMHQNRYQIDFIDVDPYGTPSPFLDSAVSTVKNNGIIAITATDLAPLCGIYKRPTLRKYSSISIHTEYCHEIAVRILIKSLAEAAGRHMRYIDLISGHFINQYIRVYARIVEGKRGYPHDNIGYLIHCEDHLMIQSCRMDELKDMISQHITCKNLLIAGPLWIGPLHNFSYISKILDNINGLRAVDSDIRWLYKILSIFKEETDFPPYFYDLHRASKRLGISVPKLDMVIEALKSVGYRCVRTHFRGTGIKTNADYRTFLDVLGGL
jgi:tRNA (guanine26-N2/guanine27-N2)-dimethyltransferase